MKRAHPLIAALYFLTRLPVTKKKIPWEDVAGGLWAFPFAGLIIGIALSLASILIHAFFPPALGSALILLCWVWITGALHIDGLIDCCDALLAPKTAKERLEILKDVSTGSFGVAGAVLFLIIKYGAIASIMPGALLIVLPLSAVTGRSAMLYVMYRFPYARKTGLGKVFKDRVRLKDIVLSLAVLLSISITVFLFPCPFYLGFASLPAALLLCELFGRWVLKRIPGFTGDVYGATCEIVETAILIFATVVLKATP
jgi:adenosylcobinamide-GDP ribazoletransferase